MRVLITRPREDAERLAAVLRPLGVEPLVEPLFRIRYTKGPGLDLDGVQALVVTSANGVRAFAARETRRDLPVYAVGDASARAAAEAGFTEVESAAGNVEDLARLVRARLDPRRGDLLHGAGSVVAGDLAGMLEKDGFTCRRAVLYEAVRAERFSAPARRALQAGKVDGVLFFSPRTARCFVELAGREDIAGAWRRMIAFCLSEAVAGEAKALAWGEVRVAARPEQGAMIEALRAWRGA